MLRPLVLRSEKLLGRRRGCIIVHGSALSGIYTGEEKRSKMKTSEM